MRQRDVFVTGMGAVSAIGNGVEAFSEALRSCRSGISCPKVLDTVHSALPVGEVGLGNDALKALLEKRMPVPDFSTRAALLGMLALDEALESASLCKDDCRKMVLVSSTAVGGMDETEKYYPFPGSVEENLIGRHDCGAMTDTIAARYGGFSMQTTVSTACSAALNAIIFGCNLIKSGRADIVVAGGAECLSKYHLNGFNSLRILDSRRCRPFDKDRAGLNLGEGAGFLVLESSSSVRDRWLQWPVMPTGALPIIRQPRPIQAKEPAFACPPHWKTRDWPLPIFHISMPTVPVRLTTICPKAAQ